ncbi:MAG: GDP-L-fucose synthase [Syntrophomonadaceae bacterium]|nr:GDP-L-fucose synthase [Bacillota bacterium]
MSLLAFEQEIVWNAAKPNGQPRRRLDTSKAKQEFGFEVKTNLRQGLKKTIEWYCSRSNGDKVKADKNELFLKH